MVFSTHSASILASIALLSSQLLAVLASTTLPPRILHSASSSPINFPVLNGTCDNRSFVPLLHILPSICARRERNDSRGSSSQILAESTSTTSVSGETTGDLTHMPRYTTVEIEIAKTLSGTRETETEDHDSDDALDESSFLSFEEWKKQMLEKTQTDPDSQQIAREGEKLRKTEGLQERLDSIIEDGEIDIDISQFLGHAGIEPDQESSQKKMIEEPATAPSHTEKSKPRNRDASTSKERFNFALDKNGGQIMKTNSEAKSASAILSENRDVYMLNECQAKGKHLIVELSEPVLVEAVAIANFEFFSSTFRQFRVSVSDRYPAKLDQWKDLGIFEAKNSRDIQAFLVEDPRIWARYLRLELMTHWGNEYYCPVSLLRVHGRNMIEDINQLSITGDEDEDSDDVSQTDPVYGVAAVDYAVDYAIDRAVNVEIVNVEGDVDRREPDTQEQPAGVLNLSEKSNTSGVVKTTLMQQMYTPWHKSQSLLAVLSAAQMERTCTMLHTPPPDTVSKIISSLNSTSVGVEKSSNSAQLGVGVSETSLNQPKRSDAKQTTTDGINLTTSAIMQGGSDTITSVTERVSSASAPSVILSSASMPTSKPSTTSTAQASHPTTQESFFKTVSKRLQLLETNATLSLKYIEEQSKILREAFSKVEKKQLRKTTDFLETLNGTIFTELRHFGRQYDQIWQSTVIELESQRDQSHRELEAVSLRLNVLADELVFQKRMSIVQSILLLLCLGLVVFSRFLAGGQIDISVNQSMLSKTRNTSGRLLESTWSSPQINSIGSLRSNIELPHLEHRRQRSDLSNESITYHSRENSPPTPLSDFSGQENDVQNYRRPDQDPREEEMTSAITDNDITRTGHDQFIHTDPINPGEDPLTEVAEDHSPISSRKVRHQSSRIHHTLHPSADADVRSSSPIYGDSSFRNVSGENRYARDVDIYPINEALGTDRKSYQLPSPPPESRNPEFSIVRKPLPAIPKE